MFAWGADMHTVIATSAEPANVCRSRDAVRDELAELHPAVVASAVLLVSELTTNVVRVGGDAWEVRVEVGDDALQVEVWDPGPGTPKSREAADLVARGWGLNILESLADHWGVRTDEAGKAVWFDMALQPERRPRSHRPRPSRAAGRADTPR
jgi:anti-sigma regulatory factor (Ser/Thr protein kinase)